MRKRVYCLYRVSTKGQVEKDDIPMQRQKCHEFALAQGWDIIQEFSEKGVSGYIISAKDRDAIQEIQRDASAGKFDILLVFMFDRLGRREDETPFVVEWFARNGIEVWSAMEGQQRFDNHVDKLMNYIRYWQASGESLKTSVRVKTRFSQIVQEGRFRGGTAPYGYQLVRNGRLGKKNRELYDIEINPSEAVAIRAIFDLADRFGYGGRKISSMLKEKGIVNCRSGDPFHYSSILNILRNVMYVGILRSGETQSEIIAELQIITPEQFDRVKRGLEQRSSDYEKKCVAAWGDEVKLADGTLARVQHPSRTCHKQGGGRTLLSGNIYCGHCSGRIFASTAAKSHHPTANGIVERVPIYKCYNRSQHSSVCDGPSTYRAEKVDHIVETLIRSIFERAKVIKEKDLVEQQSRATFQQIKQKLNHIKTEYSKATKELAKWEDLMLASVEGTCVFTPEQVKKRMDIVQEKVQDLEKEIGELQALELQSKATVKAIQEQHEQLVSWAQMYDNASLEERRIIASNIIKAVTVARNYDIHIEFNINEDQYLNGMEMS